MHSVDAAMSIPVLTLAPSRLRPLVLRRSPQLKHCAGSVPLWILAARLEEKAGAVTKARAVL